MRRPVSRLVHVGLFTVSASVGVVFALLAELQDEHGFGTVTLGAIAAVSFFAAVGAQIALAPLADRGHARHLMVGAAIAAALSAIGFALASDSWQFIAARAFGGAAFGAFSPAAQALVTAADPDRAGARLGELAGLQTAGFIIGPGIGAVVVDVTNLDGPFVLLAVVLLLISPRLATMPVDEVAPSDRVDSAPIRAILSRRDAVAAVLLSTALVLPAGMYEAIFARFMDDLGASTLFIGLSLSLYGVPFVLTAPVGGRLADRFGPLRLAPISLAVVIPLTVVYGQLTLPGMVMALAMVEAVANGLGMPAAQALMASTTTDGERATGQGLAAAAGQIGAGFAALVAAPLYGAHGPELTFAITAGLILVFGAAALVVGFSEGVERRLVPARTPRVWRTRGGGR